MKTLGRSVLITFSMLLILLLAGVSAASASGLSDPPTAVTNTDPTSGELNLSLLPTFTWTGGDDPVNTPVTYTVMIDTSVGMGAATQVSACINVTAKTCQTDVKLTPGVTYYWRVDATNSLTHTTSSTPTAFTTKVASNDTFAGPSVISSVPYTATEFTDIATTDLVNDPLFNGGTDCGSTPRQGFHSVWFSYTPLNNGLLSADTMSSTISGGGHLDTVLIVWSGSAPGSLTQVACDDDVSDSAPVDRTSHLTNVSLNGGTTYHIEVVGGVDAAVGTLVLNASYNSLPNVPSSPNPSDNATIVGPNPTLAWSGGDPDGGDTVTYDVYLDTSVTPTTNRCPAISTNQCAITGLAAGTTYHWYVKSTDNHGASVNGPTWTFTTNHAPDTPASPSPANAATNVSTNNPSLTFTGTDPDAGDTLHYDVYLDTNNPPTALKCSAATSASCSAGSLLAGTTYFWKVVTTDSLSVTATGPVWHFTTANQAPNTPSSQSPSDTAANVPTNSSLSWTGGDPDSGDTVTYQVYLNASPTPVDPSTLVNTCNGISSTSCDVSSVLLSFTKYYWKVVATDNHGATSTSSTISFTTKNQNPNVPSSPSPANAATKVVTSPTLTWSGGDPDSGDTVTYSVLLDTVNPPVAAASGCGSLSSASCPVSGLSQGVPYFWQVTATDNHGATATSSVFSFTTDRAPFAPTNTSPFNLASGISTLPTLTWTSGGDPDTGDTLKFNVYADTNSNPTTQVCANVTTPLKCALTSRLPGLSTIYWKVVAIDNHGESTTGTVTSFTTLDNAPDIPSSPSPATLATGVAQIPTLTWVSHDVDTPDIVTDKVYFGTTAKPTTLLCTVVAPATTSCAFPANHNLAYGAKFYWQVVSTDDHNASTAGPVWSFTVAAAPPAPSAPKNGSGVSTQLPKLTWKAIKGETSYIVTINGVDHPVTTTSYTPPAPLAYGFYTWHVKGAAPVVTAPSLDWSFYVTLLKTPAINNVTSNGAVSFVWLAVKGVTSYDLEVYQADADPTDPSSCNNGSGTLAYPAQNGLTSPKFPIPSTSPLGLGAYYWRVEPHASGNWSPCWRFDVSTIKPPKNGAGLNSFLPKFTWTANKAATGYQLTVFQNTCSTTPITGFDPKTTTTPSYTAVGADGFTYGHYLWQIQQNLGIGFGSPTPCVDLYISNMVKPTNNTVSVDNTPTFNWAKVTSATSYTLQITTASDPSFSAPIRTYSGLTLLTFTVPAQDGLAQGTYLWRIQTVGGPGYNMPAWTLVIGP